MLCNRIRRTTTNGTSTRPGTGQRAGRWCEAGAAADAEWLRELRSERAGSPSRRRRQAPPLAGSGITGGSAVLGPTRRAVPRGTRQAGWHRGARLTPSSRDRDEGFLLSLDVMPGREGSGIRKDRARPWSPRHSRGRRRPHRPTPASASSPGSSRAARSRSATTWARSAAGSSSSTSTVGGQVVSVGKRLSSNALLTYEQGVAGATSIVKLTWNLTRHLALIGSTGTEQAVDVRDVFSFK